MSLLQEIKKDIDKAKVISFDIFDTLLLRPYVKPIDLFKHLEYIHKIEYFQEERIKAEKNARIKHKENADINIDQIYELMPKNLQFMKEEEIAFEKQVLTVNDEIKEIFDYAKENNKTIIIASDMYLHKETLEEILNSKGYIGYKKLYVSGDCLKAKYCGDMYDLIIQENNFKPEEIIHIGDNENADFTKAKEKGINAILIPKIFNKLCNMNHRAELYYEQNQNNLEASIILGLNSILISKGVDINKNYWKYFGAIYGGPVCYSFMEYANKKAIENNIDKLFFIARDGWAIKQIFDLIKTKNIETDYIYAPRSLSLKSTLDFKRRCSISKYEAETTSKKLINIFKEEYKTEPVNNCNTTEGRIAFVHSHMDEFNKISAKTTQIYKNYLNTFNIKDKNIALIDTITTYFAGHGLLNKTLEKNILGIYWIANTCYFNDADKFYNFFSYTKNNRLNTSDWRIMEFIMTSPEAPIEKIENNKPVYKKNVTPEEYRRIKLFPEIEKGILEFTKTKLKIFGQLNLNISNETITNWINLFCTIPTKHEKEIFSNLGFAADCSHQDYQKFPRNWFEKTTSTNQEIQNNKKKSLSHSVKNKNEYNGISLYSEKRYNNKKRIRLLGVTIYTKEFSNGYEVRKYLGGLFKTKHNPKYNKAYILGIQVYKKYNQRIVLAQLMEKLLEYERKFENIEKKLTTRGNIALVNRQTHINQRLISAAFLHQKTFGPWKGAFRGKTIVLIGAGPTINHFEPIKDAIYVGCNRAFKYNKVEFDFLFSSDKVGIQDWYDEFFNYRKDKCVKFIGDQNLGEAFQIPENKIPLENVYRFVTNAGIEECTKFNLDISTSPLCNGATITIQALQWILYTQPEKIYIVGVDCTTSKKEYFLNKKQEFDNSTRGENSPQLDENNIKLYREIKNFAQTYYPDTEIISINPIGLKGIFSEEYSKSYLEESSEAIF